MASRRKQKTNRTRSVTKRTSVGVARSSSRSQATSRRTNSRRSNTATKFSLKISKFLKPSFSKKRSTRFTSVRTPTKKTSSKKSSFNLNKFFSVGRTSTVKKSTGRNSVFKRSSPTVKTFPNRDTLSKSKSLRVSNRRNKPKSVFGKKQKTITNINTGFQNRIKISTLSGFASAIKNKDNLSGFNNDFLPFIKNNSISQQDNNIANNRVNKPKSVFNSDDSGFLPPSTPQPNVIDSFFDFFSFGFNSGLEAGSQTQETGFVSDVGFQTNASEDDNPNLRPDIQISGLGGIAGEKTSNEDPDGKGFFEKIIENPIALGLIGIGILVLATRKGRR